MNQALLMNFGIMVAAVFALYLTKDPLVLLIPGLLMSQLPFGLLAQGRDGNDDDDDDEAQPMGFTQDVH